MRSFKSRSAEPEYMDEETIDFDEFRKCLRELEIINVLTLAYRPTLHFIKSLRSAAGEQLSILDAGSGGGDMLRAILRANPDRRLFLVGADLNPFSKKTAELHGGDIKYVTADIFNMEDDRKFDLIICSLFTHHLNDRQLVDLLIWLDRNAQAGWFINDLHRHWIPYYFIKLATFLFSRNRLIRHDAAVSVARAFTIRDWRSLLMKAGLEGKARIRWVFPFRICVSCRKF